MKQINEYKPKALNKFQESYLNRRRKNPFALAALAACIDKDFPDGNFNFLDIGGSNGTFADNILSKYSNSTCTLIDNSEFLLQQNKLNSRKELFYGSVENLGKLFKNRKFDVILFHLMLHHLVQDSYTASIDFVKDTLAMARTLLSDKGRLSILEYIYTGVFFSDLPSRIIYHLTSSSFVSPLARRFGAHSAGVGVCFLPLRKWVSTLNSASLKLVHYTYDTEVEKNKLIKLLLHTKTINAYHFWCMTR